MKLNQDLRLVGFPGKVEFAHPQDLKINNQANALTASDRFTDKSPSPNVGQFNLKESYCHRKFPSL